MAATSPISRRSRDVFTVERDPRAGAAGKLSFLEVLPMIWKGGEDGVRSASTALRIAFVLPGLLADGTPLSNCAPVDTHHPPRQRSMLNLLDTVVVSRSGRPETWYFTSRTGVVMRKQSSRTVLSAVLQQFRRIAFQFPTVNACIAHYGSRIEARRLARAVHA